MKLYLSKDIDNTRIWFDVRPFLCVGGNWTTESKSVNNIKIDNDTLEYILEVTGYQPTNTTNTDFLLEISVNLLVLLNEKSLTESFEIIHNTLHDTFNTYESINEVVHICIDYLKGVSVESTTKGYVIENIDIQPASKNLNKNIIVTYLKKSLR